MSIVTGTTLYKLGSKGEIRVWTTVKHFKQLTPAGLPRFGKAKDWGNGVRRD